MAKGREGRHAPFSGSSSNAPKKNRFYALQTHHEQEVAIRFGILSDVLLDHFSISTPVGESNCPVYLSLRVTHVDLLELDMLYYPWDHNSLQYVFKQKDLNLHQKRRLELLKDYDMSVLYHPGKENVVADALSQISMASVAYVENHKNELVHDVHSLTRLGVSLADFTKGAVMVHNGSESSFVMDVKTKEGLNMILIELNEVVVKCPLRLYPEGEMGHGTRVKLSMGFRPQTDGQAELTIKTFEDMLTTYVINFKGNWDDHLLLIEFAYNNNYHSSIGSAPFEGIFCRSLCSEEVSVVILDRKVWKLRNDEVSSVKVLWRNQLVEGATWDAQADMIFC
ncbi:hypothetical protein MTR67_043191 [Solanum verrucosum]|uniref:Integrase catalytic domain-containing protein n=1 Tax=Solanum verrucosum TaxID=315347 RepID=A0AAF0UQW2_SOLVR|nr:hypothetical protein MTR67_043191 [Solanum verrucosum]